MAYTTTSNDAYAFTPAGPAVPLVGANATVKAATATFGPVVQECRLQVTDEYRTRIRLWVSDDPIVGRRVEIANRVGVLPQLTDVIARITAPAVHARRGPAVFDTRPGTNACDERCTYNAASMPKTESVAACRELCAADEACSVYVHYDTAAGMPWGNACVRLTSAQAVAFGRTNPASWTAQATTTSGVKTPGGLFFSEDNGYEVIPHVPGLTNPDQPNGGIASNYYPSQVSAFIRGDGSDGNGTDALQLSVALDRSHAVAGLHPGTLDVALHRRGGPYAGSGGTVVLDDVDRVSPEMYLSVGSARDDNRVRHNAKLQLNQPPALFFGPSPGHPLKADVTAAHGYTAGLPPNVQLQSARLTRPDGNEALLRLRHLYAATDVTLDPLMAAAVPVDIAALLATLGLRSPTNMTETTLNGMIPRKELVRNRFPTDTPGAADEGASAAATAHRHTGAGDASISVAPFELRTFRSQFTN